MTNELTVPELVFPDYLDILKTIVEPDLAWVVKNPKTNLHSHPADHPDSPVCVLLHTVVHHLVRMTLNSSRRKTSPHGSYCKAPMVIPIDTKRRIGPPRLGERHEVQSTATGVGPTSQMGELDGVIGPSRPFVQLASFKHDSCGREVALI
ncbi:hypothetical protein F2Q69_00022753 [Brassica cretica]|uniref:Uncharacterized protein n=1 Tax=Brassica cretica TaxID=69181 RepID=A0A8S9QF86_BRACR|nr:hypothetical protein F2Q69_00022753 [Brassica cretica]